MQETKNNGLAVTERKTAEIMPTAETALAEMEIQATIISAKKFPRNEDIAFEKLTKSCKRLSFADEAEYSFRRGGKPILGPSVNLAREAARVWGNIRYGLKIVTDEEDSVTIEGWAWDIETNVKVACQDSFQKLHQRKNKTSGITEWITPNERDLRELINRRGAITIRNSILQLLPRDLIEDAQAECRKTRQAKVKRIQPEELMKKWIKAFSSLKPFGVSVEMLEKYLDHPLKECSLDEWDNLKMIYNSINDGNSTWKDYVEDADQQKDKINGTLNPDDLKPKKDDKKKTDPVPVELKDAIAEVGNQTTMDGLSKIWDKYPTFHGDKDFSSAVENIRSNIESVQEEDSKEEKPVDGRENGMFDQPGK